MASVPPGSHPGPPSPSTRTTPAKRKRPNFGTPWDLGYHLPKSHKGDNGQLEIRQSPPPILGGTTARERRKSRSGFTRRSATFGVHIHPVRGEGSVNDARATGMLGAGPLQSMPRPTIMVPRPVSSSSFSMQPNEPFLPHVLSSDALMVSPDILIVDPPALPVTSSYTSFDGVLEDPSGTPGGQELTQGPSLPTAGFANSVPTDALRMEPWQVLGNSYQSQASQPPPGQPSAHQQHSPCSRSSTTESLSTNYAFPQAETPLPTVGFHSTSATIRETVKDASGAARGHELSQGPSPPLGSANSIPTEPGQVSGSFSQWQASEPAPGPTHQQYSSSFHSSTTETHPSPSISIRSPSSNILTDTETEQMSGGSSQRQAPEPISSLAHQQCYPLASHPSTVETHSFNETAEDTSDPNRGNEFSRGLSPPLLGIDHRAAPPSSDNVLTDVHPTAAEQISGDSSQWPAPEPTSGSAYQQYYALASHPSTAETHSFDETAEDTSGPNRGYEFSRDPLLGTDHHAGPPSSDNVLTDVYPTAAEQMSEVSSQWQASELAPGPTHQQYSSTMETQQASELISRHSSADQQHYPLASHPSTAETHSFNETAEDTSGPNRGYEFSRGPSPPLLGTDHHAAPFFSDNVLTDPDVHLSEAEQIYGDSSQWRASEPTPAAFSGSRLYMPSLPASKTPPDAFRIEQQHVPEGFFPPSSGMQGRPTNAQAHPLYAANRATPVSTAAMRLSRQPLSASVTQHPVAPDTCRVASTANIAGVGIHSSMGQVSSSAGINPPNLTPLSPSISPSRYNSYAGSLSNQQADPGNPYFTSQQFQTAPPSVALYTDVDSRQRLPASGTAASLYPAAPAQLLADRQNENNDRGYEEVYPNSGDRLPPSQNLVQLFDERFDALGRLFRDSERQRQQELDSLSSQVGDLHRRVGAVRGPPPTARPRKKLDAQDERLKHPFRKQFLTNLRRHLHFLLNIKDKSQLCLITPLTREEINAFNLRLPTAIRITTTNWKYDFCQADGTPFNLEAIQVFVDHFLQCINAGWYSHPEPTPDNFKDREFVQDSLERQLYYARQMYKAQTQPTGARRPYNPRRAKRKRKLYRDRHAAMCKDPELAAELEFFEAAGHHAVSSDESDVDEVDIGRSDRSSASRTFTRVKLLWRSELLRSLHYRADESSARSLQSRVAVKKRNGAPPRRRIDPIVDNYNPTAIAPPGLSRDSYNSGWLESLDESELNDLKIA